MAKNDALVKEGQRYAATPLNEKMRRRLADKILAHALEVEREELADFEHSVGSDVYDDVYSAGERRAMARLPAGFLYEQDSLDVKIGGCSYQAKFLELRRVASKHLGWQGAKTYPVEHSLAKLVYEAAQRRERYQQKRQQEHARVMGVLRSCRTARQLAELWPEVVQFLDVALVVEKKPVTDLAPVIRDLSRDLGL